MVTLTLKTFIEKPGIGFVLFDAEDFDFHAPEAAQKAFEKVAADYKANARFEDYERDGSAFEARCGDIKIYVGMK